MYCGAALCNVYFGRVLLGAVNVFKRAVAATTFHRGVVLGLMSSVTALVQWYTADSMAKTGKAAIRGDKARRVSDLSEEAKVGGGASLKLVDNFIPLTRGLQQQLKAAQMARKGESQSLIDLVREFWEMLTISPRFGRRQSCCLYREE